MRKGPLLKCIMVVFISLSSAGCALGLIDMALGDKKATHANDQSVETGNRGYVN